MGLLYTHNTFDTDCIGNLEKTKDPSFLFDGEINKEKNTKLDGEINKEKSIKSKIGCIIGVSLFSFETWCNYWNAAIWNGTIIICIIRSILLVNDEQSKL